MISDLNQSNHQTRKIRTSNENHLIKWRSNDKKKSGKRKKSRSRGIYIKKDKRRRKREGERGTNDNVDNNNSKNSLIDWQLKPIKCKQKERKKPKTISHKREEKPEEEPEEEPEEAERTETEKMHRNAQKYNIKINKYINTYFIFLKKERERVK